jgi:hypothetical protein
MPPLRISAPDALTRNAATNGLKTKVTCEVKRLRPIKLLHGQRDTLLGIQKYVGYKFHVSSKATIDY